MNKKKIWIPVIAAVLAVALGGGAFLAVSRSNRPAAVYPVSMLSYVSNTTSSGESYGVVTADKVQTIYVSDTQTVTRISVYEGQTVKKGDLLYTYDTTLSDLTLERKDLAIQQMELTLKTAKSDLEKLKKMKPMVVTTPSGSEEGKSPKDKNLLGSCYGGSGTERDPYLFWMTDGASVNQDLVWSLFDIHDKTDIYVVFQSVKGNGTNKEFDQEFGVRFTVVYTQGARTPVGNTGTEDGSEIQEQTEATAAPTDPTEGTETEPTGETAAPTEGTEPTEAPDAPTDETEPTGGTGEPEQPDPEPTEPSEMEKSYLMRFFDPNDEETGTQIDWNSGYTQAELTSMREEKTAQITQLEFDIKMGKAELEIMKKETSDGNVYAEFDGVVVTVLEPDNAREMNLPMIKITGGGGYYVEGQVSELELNTLQVGMAVNVNSWEIGAVYTGVVTEIGVYPAEHDGYAGTGANVTYYPYKLFIDENADLQEGAFVSLTYETGADQAGVLYLENAFLCTEGRETYVYVRGEDGLLEKRYIQTGPSADGYATPVYSGLMEEDWIAFPYDRDLREGMDTEESPVNDLYGY